MTKRPEILLKVALSLDGCIDDAAPQRRSFSNPADMAAVDVLRAESDAILVGAETVRQDNPGLLIRDRQLIASRLAAGRSEQPLRVTISKSGALSRDARIFSERSGRSLVYTYRGAEDMQDTLGARTDVVKLDHGSCPLTQLVTDLAARGVTQLLVEGGTKIIGQFLQAGLVDRMRLAIAPVVIGEPLAPRFITEARAIPRAPQLYDIDNLNGMAILWYRFDSAV